MKTLIYRVRVVVSILLLSSIPLSLSASELYQFAMYYSGEMKKEDCALVPRYSANQKEVSVYQGLLIENGCVVTMTRPEFEVVYQFCFLAGFNLHELTDPKMIECTFQQRDDDYMFLASGKQGQGVNQVMCYFSCVGGSGK